MSPTDSAEGMVAASDQQPVHPALDAPNVSETLLSSVAHLKGFTDEAISSAINAPKGTIGAYFAGRKVGYREDMRTTLAAVLGVDLAAGRLKSDCVHVFRLDKLPFFTSRKRFDLYLQSIGYLLRGSRAAKLTFSSLDFGPRLANGVRGIYVAQNKQTRAILVGGWCAGFHATLATSKIEGIKWANKGARTNSVVDVCDPMLATRICNGDITVTEFDEIFRGAEATTWSDVEMSARVNLVSRDEIVNWIETVGNRRAMERLIAAKTQETAADRWVRESDTDTSAMTQLRMAAGK